MNINGVNVEMTCDNKDKFYQSKILIERQIIQDSEGKQLFFIDYYDSENNEFECDISLNVWSTESPSSNEPDTTDNTNNERRYIKKSSGGLSGGAIAGIVIACVVVLATVAIIAVLAKKGVFSGSKAISSNSNNNSTIINFRNN